MGETKDLVVYETSKGEVALSINVVRELFCKEATDNEIGLFMQLCKFQGLNPFLKEAYLVKYGTNPASIIVGKETFTKRANRHDQFDGYETGLDLAEDGSVIGAWSKVYRKDRQYPVSIQVDFDEYAQRNKEGQLVKNWKEKPKTMIRKVALVQGLREAFPEELGGLYEESEVQVVDVTPPGAKTVTPGQPTPHAASTSSPQKQAQAPKAPASGNGGSKPRYKNPDAPASPGQIKALCAVWAKPLGFNFGDLQEQLDGNPKVTMQIAGTLIEEGQGGDCDRKRWTDLTGIECPPDEQEEAAA